MLLGGVQPWVWFVVGGLFAGVTLYHARKERIGGILSIGLYVLSLIAFMAPIVLVNTRMNLWSGGAMYVAFVLLSFGLDNLSARVKKPK